LKKLRTRLDIEGGKQEVMAARSFGHFGLSHEIDSIGEKGGTEHEEYS
jgi:hypothetical protein